MELSADLFMWAFPVLVVLALVEGYAYTRLKKRAFDWRESLASFFVAVGHKASGLALGSLVFGFFAWLTHFQLFHIPDNTWWGLMALFFGVEFFYYWQHRLSHEIRWIWASHAVHHSAEHINFSAAYRLGWTGVVSGIAFFFIPMVLIGFAPRDIFLMLGVNLLYQFWIHTELVPSLGWFDLLFNSPANHRVHHASNAEYLDKNYGGVLIIFDRMFGTYKAEDKAIDIKFGVLGRERTNNPFTIALREWKSIAQDVLGAKTWQDRLHYMFDKPGWKPEK